GAAGAFLLVPIMLVVLKIPTKMTIASSLAITFISSIGSTVGKITTGQIDYFPAFIMIVASIIAAPLGAKTGKNMNTKVLQVILATLITATAVKIWIDILYIKIRYRIWNIHSITYFLSVDFAHLYME